MKLYAQRLVRLILLLAILLSSRREWISSHVAAQSDNITWSRPTNLSNTPQASAHPVIVADEFGYVHVFWSEEIKGRVMGPEDKISNTGNTIVYSRWDGVSWTFPVDILLVNDQDLAEWPAVTLDADSRFHIVWTSTTNIYYSKALSWEAGSAVAWSEPTNLADDSASAPWGADVATDQEGNIYVVYAARGNKAGIYFVSSANGGATWGPAVRLSAPFDPTQEAFATVQIVVDASGNLHTIWRASEADGSDQAIYYISSTDKGITWTAPMQLAYQDPEDFVVAFPYLMALAPSELHLIYADGPVVGSQGRYHRISSDGGLTWSEPYHIIDEMMGVNGYVIPLVDGAEQMHLIINMRTADTQVVGIYYAKRQGDGWSQVQPVDVSISSAHFMDAAIQLGNEIHIVYTQIASGEIWHIQGSIPLASQTPARSLPPTPTSIPTAEIQQADTNQSASAATATPHPRAIVALEQSPPIASPPPLGQPLIIGVGVALLLLASVIALKRIRL